MDQFDAMRAFVQAVDRGSCTRAARQLEDRVGTRLLAGTTRSVTPTADGLTYCRHARTLLEQVDVAEAMLRKGASAPAGRLRVNVAVAMGRLVFAPEIRGLLERHPRFTLEQGCSDRAVDLVGEGADCALRGGVLDSQLSTRPVGDRRFVLYAEPHCIDGRGLPDIPDDLVGRHQVRQRRRPLPGAGRARPHRAGGVRRQPLPTSGALVRVLAGWQCPSLPLHLVTATARKYAARVQA